MPRTPGCSALPLKPDAVGCDWLAAAAAIDALLLALASQNVPVLETQLAPAVSVPCASFGRLTTPLKFGLGPQV